MCGWGRLCLDRLESVNGFTDLGEVTLNYEKNGVDDREDDL